MLSTALLALILASDIFDFALEAKGLKLAERFHFLRTHFSGLAGLAVALVILGSVPAAFIVALPMIVAGASDFVATLEEKGKSQNV